jgi:hypothetical protein
MPATARFLPPGLGPRSHPHLAPAGWVTGSSARLPGVGRSLSGQHPASVLHKTPSCSTWSRCSDSSSHWKAPAESVCPGQGSWSRKTKTNCIPGPMQVCVQHSLVSLTAALQEYVIIRVTTPGAEKRLAKATWSQGNSKCTSPKTWLFLACSQGPMLCDSQEKSCYPLLPSARPGQPVSTIRQAGGISLFPPVAVVPPDIKHL